MGWLAGLIAGMAAGGAAVWLMKDSKAVRSTRRGAKRALRSAEELLEDLRDKLN